MKWKIEWDWKNGKKHLVYGLAIGFLLGLFWAKLHIC